MFPATVPLRGRQRGCLGRDRADSSGEACLAKTSDCPAIVLTYTQETIAIVRAAFPPLREFPPDRVEFMLKNNGSDWQRVLPNVWETIAKDPPERLGVRIADGPGDAEERQRRGGSPVF